MEVDRDPIMKCLPHAGAFGLDAKCGNSFKDFNQGRKMMCFGFWKISQLCELVETGLGRNSQPFMFCP